MSARAVLPLAVLLATLLVSLHLCRASVSTQLYWPSQFGSRAVLADRECASRLQCAASCLRLTDCVAHKFQGGQCLLLGARVSPTDLPPPPSAVADHVASPDCPTGWTPLAEACYLYTYPNGNKVAFQLALSVCQGFHPGAYPIIIASTEKLDNVVTRLAIDQHIIIGLNRTIVDTEIADGELTHWAWYDGTPLTFNLCPSGEPKNSANDRRYMVRDKNGDWKSKRAHDTEHLVCEFAV